MGGSCRICRLHKDGLLSARTLQFFYNFRPSLCPILFKSIDPEKRDRQSKSWVSTYHETNICSILGSNTGIRPLLYGDPSLLTCYTVGCIKHSYSTRVSLYRLTLIAFLIHSSLRIRTSLQTTMAFLIKCY